MLIIEQGRRTQKFIWKKKKKKDTCKEQCLPGLESNGKINANLAELHDNVTVFFCIRMGAPS